jgi:hypothetical protein
MMMLKTQMTIGKEWYVNNGFGYYTAL